MPGPNSLLFADSSWLCLELRWPWLPALSFLKISGVCWLPGRPQLSAFSVGLWMEAFGGQNTDLGTRKPEFKPVLCHLIFEMAPGKLFLLPFPMFLRVWDIFLLPAQADLYILKISSVSVQWMLECLLSVMRMKTSWKVWIYKMIPLELTPRLKVVFCFYYACSTLKSTCCKSYAILTWTSVTWFEYMCICMPFSFHIFSLWSTEENSPMKNTVVAFLKPVNLVLLSLPSIVEYW